MESNKFKMPFLQNQRKKREQIAALQIVREAAAQAHKAIQQRKTLIRNLLGANQVQSGRTARNRNGIHCYKGDVGEHTNQETIGQVFLYNNTLIAEQTIQKYKGPGQDVANPANLPVKLGPGGLLYPYMMDELDVLSRRSQQLPVRVQRLFLLWSGDIPYCQGGMPAIRKRRRSSGRTYGFTSYIPKSHSTHQVQPIL